ncbi:MAG TPA: ABC transporter ATP-binding protein [Blastocatellia bacterium]|jgi:ABC-type Fe3+/spermidine/putrescine transport system ATPase subunit|nr:ABC transporter ATP-binding protein [Blastocatellia bacterium]
MAGKMSASFQETRSWAAAETEKRQSVIVCGLSKWFGSEQVLDDVSFSIGAGETLVLLGPSGSGKSTTLRLIAGLETPDTGEISLRGKRIEHLRARDRNIGVIFQNYALFPRMTVAENIGFGLRIRKWEKTKRGEVVGRLLDLIGLVDQRDKYPSQISGGQQQRVAIARALAYEPDLLLFDESFSALDPQTRTGLRREIRVLLRKLRIPALFITHDQEEALEMGDQIAILNRGRLEQLGAPDEVYNDPQTEFVATFLGAANVVEGCWRDGFIALDCEQCLRAPRPATDAVVERIKMIFRPEDITLGSPTGLVETPHHLGRGEIIDVSFTGATESLTIKLLPRGYTGPSPNSHCDGGSDKSCNLMIKAVRTKWEAKKLRLTAGSSVSIGLRSYKIL